MMSVAIRTRLDHQAVSIRYRHYTLEINVEPFEACKYRARRELEAVAERDKFGSNRRELGTTTNKAINFKTMIWR